MKIKFGSIVTDGRGKLGGHVYSKNKSGAYVRTNVIPSNPDTIAQRLVRQAFGRISQQWAALSATNKKLWLDATADWKNTDQFGDLKALTAKALYQGLNTQANQAGFPAEIKSPMPKMDLGMLALESVSVDLTANEVTFDPPLTSVVDTRYQLFVTPPLSAGIISYKGKERLLTDESAVATPVKGKAIYNAYIAKHGSLNIASTVYIGVRSVGSNGQAGVLQMVRAKIEA